MNTTRQITLKFVLCMCFVTSVCAYGQKLKPHVNSKDWYGYVDETGKEIIPFKYDYVKDFSDGLAKVECNYNDFGYIDETGKEVIPCPCKYDKGRDFSEGLAPVEGGNDWGYIDKTGKEIIPLKYTAAGDFSEGLAGVRNFDREWGFIDKTGKEIIPHKYDDASDFSEGLAPVKFNGKWGFIDKTGKEIIPYKYDEVRFPYGEVPGFLEGLSPVKLNEKWGCIDKTGKIIIPIRYEYIERFSEGLVAVKLNGKYGFVDMNGKEIIPFKYDNAHGFSEGLVSVELNGKWGFVDRTGREVIPFKYNYAANFTEGLAQVSNFKYSGFVDKTGKVVIPLKYEEVEDFTDGLAWVTLNNKKYCIDKSGEMYRLLTSEVDVNIPATDSKNDKTFAVIIANENYQSESTVLYAKNDGETFKKYCIQTLGIPAINVHYQPDAMLNQIRDEINWLKQVAEAYNGEANIIFYYAGHGIPDENSKNSYLLPVDGYGTDITTGYKLDDLYQILGNLPVRSVTLFMDACFSGAGRDGQMLTQARGVRVTAKSGAPSGNMVVFSSSQGDETSFPYKEKGHGLFTYFLLKKLQETKGEVTLGELGDYVTTQVGQQSILVNRKSQTPTVTTSATMGDSWKELKLK